MVAWFVGLWCLTPLSTINFSYIVVVSFIGGENRSTRRKPEDPEKTRGPGENRSTRRKPEYPE
jgi:hypothetical protein